MNKKVLAMYQAVVELLEAGVDITTLKVADITKQAGIGKGTAYEYFSSKEEIIAKALHWDLSQQLEAMGNSLKCVGSMKEQIFMGLTWIEENVHRKSMTVQFMRSSANKGQLDESCRYMTDDDIQDMIHNLCDIVLSQGEKEGVVSASLPVHLKYYVLISNCIGFIVMINQKDAMAGIDPAEIKQYIYEIMIKSLQ